MKCDNIEDHKMHFEEYSISTGNARIINQAIDEGRRIVSVGTTSTRTLESAAEKDPETGNYHVKAGHNSTGIFIYPGYEFKIVGRSHNQFSPAKIHTYHAYFSPVR